MALAATSIVFEDQIEVPLTVRSLAEFRRWALSDEFPETGRIDFIDGRIEVEMSPEDLFCHGTLKGEIAAALRQRIKRDKLGHLFIDKARITSPRANLSVEPDIVFLSYDTLRSDQVRLTPKAGGKPGRYVEVEGAPDLIVEIISDSSVAKDTRRLPAAYFQAGVREFWLADARGETPVFIIHRPGPSGFEPVAADADGFQPSAVLGCRYPPRRRPRCRRQLGVRFARGSVTSRFLRPRVVDARTKAMNPAAKSRFLQHADRLVAEGREVLGTKTTVVGSVAPNVVPPPPRVDLQKLTKWITGCRNLVHQIGDAARAWWDSFPPPVGVLASLAAIAMGNLEALRESIDMDALVRVEDLITADAFASLLEQAKELLAKDYTLAAGVLGRAVLEEHLRKLCDRHSCLPSGRPTVNDLNQTLYKGSHLDKLGMKQADTLAAAGNHWHTICNLLCRLRRYESSWRTSTIF